MRSFLGKFGKLGNLYSSDSSVIISGVPPIMTNKHKLLSLKAFGGTEQRSLLPSEYTQVEYLESTGTQYIDTGYALITDNFEIIGSGVKKKEAGIFFGARDITAPYTGILESRISNSLISFWAGNSWATFAALQNTKYNFKIVCSSNLDCIVSCSGFTDKTFTATQTYVNGSNIYLFTNNPLIQISIVDIYSFSIKDNGVLVRNLIPCRRNSDNVLGMYDTVTGNFLTNAGTGTFIAGADVTTPSPEIPMNILCNNGVLKVRHQSGLPLGYTLLDYIESTGTQYIDTGIIHKNLIVEYEALTTNVSNTSQIFLATSVAANWVGWKGGKPICGGEQIILDATQRRKYKATYTSTDITLIDTETGLTATTLNGSINNTLYLFSYPASQYPSYTRLFSCKMSEGTVLVRNLIPCRRNSDNVLGMFDLVSQNFLTNAGTDDFVAGNSVSDPVEVYADGTTETVTINTTGDTATAEMLLKVGTYKDEQSVLDGNITKNIGIKVLDGTENWGVGDFPNRFALNAFNDIAKIPNKNVGYSNCYMVVARSSNIQQNLQNNQCGWNTTYVFFVRDDRFTTAEQFAAWLADQYNAGTPVIIIYPLATPTTKQVAGQTLTLTKGTNIIDITQASLDNLELEVKAR